MMQQLFSEYLVYMKANKNYAKSTIAYNSSVLREFVNATDKGIEELEPYDIDKFLLLKSETCKKSTLNLTKGVLRAFLEYCQVYRGIAMRFDYQLIRRKKDPPSEVSYLTKEQVEMAILQMKHPQDRLITKTFFETGMRIGEVVNLKAENIGFWEVTIKGKGGYTRVVPINDGLHTALRNHLYLNNITKGPVFRQIQKQRNNSRETYAEDTIRKRLQREFAKVGIKMHPHMLRHGFGTHLLINDVDLRSIQSLMGHKSLETTQIYTHVTGKHLKKAVACFV